MMTNHFKEEDDDDDLELRRYLPATPRDDDLSVPRPLNMFRDALNEVAPSIL